eukprot:2008699-Pyramimonas_sp.AAC.1
MWAVLGAFWDSLVPSWGVFGLSSGSLEWHWHPPGSLSGPLGAVLGLGGLLEACRARPARTHLKPEGSHNLMLAM